MTIPEETARHIAADQIWQSLVLFGAPDRFGYDADDHQLARSCGL